MNTQSHTSESNSTASSTAFKALMVGRPNAGKTSVYNRLTGHRLKTGNYHGVTVEHAEGTMKLGTTDLVLIDLPGTPSLVPHSPDEGLTSSATLNASLGQYDVLVTIVDATRLVEGLYLSLQVIELGWPTLVVINQIDLAEQAGLQINLQALSESLKQRRTESEPVQFISVLAVSALTGQGIDELRSELETLCLASQSLSEAESINNLYTYPWVAREDLRSQVSPQLLAELQQNLPKAVQSRASHLNAYLHWLVLGRNENEAPIDAKLRLLALSEPTLQSTVAEQQIVERYTWLDQESPKWLKKKTREGNKEPQASLSARIDDYLLQPLLGSLVFIMLMILMFQALFVGADPFIAMIEDAVAWVAGLAQVYLPTNIISEFIIEGLINGVGNVIVFLPQVLILFGLIGLMEDSGYMSRAAALTDRVMRRAGLSGRAFVPMLSGFICAVPAILATRTLPQRRDRLLTMMALPLLTCSARLPVYTLLIATLLPDPGSTLGIDHRAWVMVLLYLFATFSAFAAVWVMGKTILRGETPPLLIHLPDYRKPVAKDVLQRLGTRAMVFIKEAGSVILAGTIVLWILLSFPRLDQVSPELTAAESSSATASQQLTSQQLAHQRAQSYGGQLGRLMEPMLRPLGWDWQVGVGLIGAFAAREVFVSTLGMVYGVGAEVDEESISLRDKIKSARHRDGSPVFTPISALALLIFFSLACQCLSTLAAVKRETGGYRWPLFMFGYMSVLAYTCALLVTWVGSLI